MKVTRIPISEFDDHLVHRWQELQAADSSLASPYFCVEYMQAASRAGLQVNIAVIEVDGVVEGFFPFETVSRMVARPVGGRLSDWNGLVAHSGLQIDATELMRASGLRIWDFDHVPASQHWLEPHANVHDRSPIMELTRGYQAYLDQRKESGSQRLSRVLSKARKFEREVGSLRFEGSSRDPRAFRQMIQWKREQCLRTGVPDFLSWGWTTSLLEQIDAVDTVDFAGRLSVLWHDDTVLAAHFGMRSRTAWHWWLPTYNHDYASYSPGAILLLRVAEFAAQEGVDHIDLGRGDDSYKDWFATDSLPLLEGSVLVPSISSARRRLHRSSSTFLRHSSALAPGRAAYRYVRTRLAGAPAAGTT